MSPGVCAQKIVSHEGQDSIIKHMNDPPSDAWPNSTGTRSSAAETELLYDQEARGGSPEAGGYLD